MILLAAGFVAATTLSGHTFHVAPVDPIALMYQGKPWSFMGQKFVVEPYKKTNDVIAKIKSSLALIGGGVGGFLSMCMIFELTASSRRVSEATKFANFLVALGAMGVSALLSRSMFERWARFRADAEAFVEFIRLWPEYRRITPITLHDAFDNFYLMSLQPDGRDQLLNHMQEAVATIRKRIYQECEGQYTQYFVIENHNVQTGTFTHFFVHFDPVHLIEVLLHACRGARD